MNPELHHQRASGNQYTVCRCDQTPVQVEPVSPAIQGIAGFEEDFLLEDCAVSGRYVGRIAYDQFEGTGKKSVQEVALMQFSFQGKAAHVLRGDSERIR